MTFEDINRPERPPRPPRIIDFPVLVTERLVLRSPHVEDMDAIAELANNRRVSAMLQTMPYPFTRKHAAEFILRAVAGELGHCVYAMTLADSGAFIGACRVFERKDAQGFEISYWLGQPFWNKGYASEAINCLIGTIFRATNIEKLYVSCLMKNAASLRIIEKTGFQLTNENQNEPELSQEDTLKRYVLDRTNWLWQLSLCA